jgi:hypothetical protein
VGNAIISLRSQGEKEEEEEEEEEEEKEEGEEGEVNAVSFIKFQTPCRTMFLDMPTEIGTYISITSNNALKKYIQTPSPVCSLRRHSQVRIIKIKSGPRTKKVGPIPFKCHGHLPQILRYKGLLEASTQIHTSTQ